MNQKCINRQLRRRVGDSAFKLAAICCVLVLALAPIRMLAAEAENLPPAETQLAFVRDDQIFLVNADGSNLIQLTASEPGIVNMDPAWSRDGQRLAFARHTLVGEVLGGGDIYIVDADGSNVLQLTHGGGVEPTWGPDDRIAFIGGLGLSVMDVDAADSQEPTTLLDRPGYNAQPAWSPDGQTITFTSDYRAYDFLYDLYAMNADGTDIRPLLEGPFFDAEGRLFYFQSAWAPGGQNIAVVTCPYAWDDCYTLGSEIAVANADGSDLRVIAQAGGFASPTWSPDGEWIAYGSTLCRSCESSIRFVSVDGGVEGLLMDDGHSPAWRPDTLNAPEDPEGPVKEPDEPKKPPRSKLPGCVLKCDKKKLTGADFPGEIRD